MNRAYLDHASSSPLRPATLEAMLPFLSEHHGDPGRLHAEGRTARVAVEEAREHVALLFGARPSEVVFTSSGTEAVNTAIWGAIAKRGRRGHVVITVVEHSAVHASIERSGAEISVVGVDHVGRFDPDEVAATVRADTVLVSVQLANHEVGTVQRVPAVDGTLLHVDACAAAGHLPISFSDLGADLASVTAHKLGGPKGVGAVLVRRGLRLPPLVVGGAQERARRAGLENVPAIVGFGAACAELSESLDTEVAAQRALSDACVAGALAVPGVHLLGDPEPRGRLPHLICLSVDGVEAEPILLALDQHGVAVHSGSSCSSEMLEPSPVLRAMGVDAEHSLRVSVGWNTTSAEIARFTEVFPGIVERLRSLRAG